MFYGWISNLDGSRLPEFRHIVVRSKIEDGKRVNLIISTSYLVGLVLWTTIIGAISIFLAVDTFIPSGLWVGIIASAVGTFAPAIVQLINYFVSWRNYAR